MKAALSAALSLACTVCAFAQGTFENLDFEAAKIVLVDGSLFDVATSNALPGWSAFSGTNQLATVPYNLFGAIPRVGLFGSNSYAIAGTYTAEVWYGGSISQTGSVPPSARSLLFETPPGAQFPPLDVSLGGQSLSYIVLSNSPSFVLWGADVSVFAGQTAALTFSGASLLDDIVFSPKVIPQPATTLVVLSGALTLSAGRLRIRSRNRLRPGARRPVAPFQ